MVKSHIDVALPEESAGAAYEEVKRELIVPFEKFIGQGRIREHDWSLKGRIQTNGGVIEETIAMAGADKDAVLVKGPGITPTREQTAEQLRVLGDARAPEELSKLVTGSPNGYLRGHWLVKGNLERYANPGLSAYLNLPLPACDKAGKVDVLCADGGREKDGFFHILTADADVWVECGGRVVRAPERLSAGSAVYAKTTRRADVEALAQKAIDAGREIRFMSKYTVRPELDGEKKKIYNDVRERNGLERKEGNQGDIVDAAFARLLANPVADDLTVLAPDASYGPKIKAVIEAAYTYGVKRPESDFSVCRFSAGKSEYGGLNKVAREDCEFSVFIGDRHFKFPVAKGDMFEEMHYDARDASTYVRQVFDSVQNKGYDRAVFAFDEGDLYDKPVVDAVRAEALKRKKVENDDFVIVKPDEAAVLMFTKPLPAKTVYAYDNLWGDIVSDAMDLGAGVASINSVILLADGRVWAEMGGAGTAPALAESFKREGFWRYNPLPVIEGMAIGFAQAAKNEPENTDLARYAAALHQAYLNVIASGVATPDLSPELKAENKKAVDMVGFIKKVRVELARLLGDEAQAKEQEEIYGRIVKEIL